MSALRRRSSAITLVLLLFTGSAFSQARSPNVLVIHTDEHHYRTLGCYGGSIVDTKNIDWIAAQGALCSSFYATSPVCSPSRAAFVTGRYPQSTSVVTNSVPLPDDVVTFAEALRRQGYATGYAGKWHLDGNGKPQWAPTRRFGFEDNRFMFNRGHWKKLELLEAGPRVASRNARGKPSYALNDADPSTFTTDWLTDRALAFIEEHGERPWCYMLSLPDPHGPNTVRAPYDTMYKGIDIVPPSTFHEREHPIPGWAPRAEKLTIRQLERIMPSYYGMVKCIDENVGRLLSSLRRVGRLEDTIIVFTSDHGDLCGEHGRLNKGVPYEGSARIPFLIYAHGRVDPGTVVSEALSCVDFFPTLFGLLGLTSPEGIEGRDASPLLQGRSDSWEDIAFLRGTPNAGWLCAVTDRYKLVYSPRDSPWLYDLEREPDERVNRFDDPELSPVIEGMTRRLDTYCKKRRDPYSENERIREQMDRVLK